MKTCPECLNQVVDAAIACKYCGHKFEQRADEEPAISKTHAVGKSVNYSLGYIVMALFAIAVLAVAIYAYLNFQADQKIRPTEDSSTTIMAAIMCEQFVEDKLKAPKTAEFQNAYQAESQEIETDLFAVKSYVDAENSFGAMIRTDYECRIHYVGNDEWQLIALEILE